MLYLNKLLNEIKKSPLLLKSPNIILVLGITSTHIKKLKKHALENQLITQSKQEYFLTKLGEEYLLKNPNLSWNSSEYPQRPEINVEYFKEEKTPPALTKAIRIVAKYLLEGFAFKEESLEKAIVLDIEKCKKLYVQIELDILNGERNSLEKIYEKFSKKGITKSLFFTLVLFVLTKNLDRIAIYEKSQFQLKFDTLMFDRMIACSQNFEVQRTEMLDEYILKDISKIIINSNSNNILEITKGLYSIIKKLDKYTMNTQNLSPKTLRLRNVILNAKDPISLFERDIPRVFGFDILKNCDRKFLNNLKLSLNELKECSSNLIKDLKDFIYITFKAESREDLLQRFLLIKDYLNEKELKVLFSTISDTNVTEDLWVNRIATFINQSRVPKDWSDEDYADFKIKAKELALKMSVLEAVVGNYENVKTKNTKALLNKYLCLSKGEQIVFLREAINL